MSQALQRAQAFVARLSYKPGSRIEVRDYEDQGLWVVLTVDQPNLSGSGTTSISTRRPLSLDERGDHPEAWILSRVMAAIRELELHEVCEWFKCDGVCVEDPHPELRKEAEAADFVKMDFLRRSAGLAPRLDDVARVKRDLEQKKTIMAQLQEDFRR